MSDEQKSTGGCPVMHGSLTQQKMLAPLTRIGGQIVLTLTYCTKTHLNLALWRRLLVIQKPLKALT